MKKRESRPTELRFTDEEIDALINTFLDEWRNAPTPESAKKPWWNDDLKDVRRLAILRMIRRGLSTCRMVEEIMARWKVSHQSARNYIKDCLESLVEVESKKSAQQVKNELQERLYHLLEEATNNGKIREALQAADMLAKINGEYVTKQEIDLNAKADIQFKFGGQ